MKEYKLTIDDLISEYLMAKVNNGYEPNFTTSEFLNFLYYFDTEMKLDSSFYEKDKIFKSFFGKKENDSILKNPVPYLDIIYDKELQECIVSVNYNFGDYYKSTLNTYFLDNGMGRLGKGKTGEIRKIINNYLTRFPKRKIEHNCLYNDTKFLIGKYIAAMMVQTIWKGYVYELISQKRWPSQCKDINKYLFEYDLAEIINARSIKSELINFYNEVSKRISIMYHNDKKLKISSYHNSYLARSNFDAIIRGYEKLVEYGYGSYKDSLGLDFTTLSFSEYKPKNDIYSLYDDINIKNNLFNQNTDAKSLIRNLDNSNQGGIK